MLYAEKEEAVKRGDDAEAWSRLTGPPPALAACMPDRGRFSTGTKKSKAQYNDSLLRYGAFFIGQRGDGAPGALIPPDAGISLPERDTQSDSEIDTSRYNESRIPGCDGLTASMSELA